MKTNAEIGKDIQDEIGLQPILNAAENGVEVNNNAVGQKDRVVSGTKVLLTGTATLWFQKDEAGRIAWNAHGIERVVNAWLLNMTMP
jgi:hypothetical protein